MPQNNLTRMQPSMKVLHTSLKFVAVAALLGGCAVVKEPIPKEEIVEIIQKDAKTVEEAVPFLNHPLDLAAATARALKYNLANRVNVMEAALAAKNFELAKLDMLPVLSSDLGYQWRNNEDASVSRDLVTGLDTVNPTFSDERRHFDGELRFSYNLLDFGVSYLQAKQEADRALISDEVRKKASARLVQQVRTSFWRVAALQRVSPSVDILFERVNLSLHILRKARKAGLSAPIQVLEEQRALLEIVQQLETMRQSIAAAQIELANLINSPPSSEIDLIVGDDLPPLPELVPNFEDLELLALANSTDYAEQIYNLRIVQTEARKAVLRLFPGVELFSSFNFDTNEFLTNRRWYEAGARVSWNLFSLLSIDEIQESNEARTQAAVARRLAASMAVITGVHVAFQGYENARTRLHQAEELDSIDREIGELTRQAEASRAATGLQSLRTEIRALRSNVAKLLAYADAQDIYGRLLFSLGLTPVGGTYAVDSDEALAAKIRTALSKWDRGEFPKTPEPSKTKGSGVSS